MPIPYWNAWANITQVSGFKLDVVAQAQHIGRVVDCGPGHAGIRRECRSEVSGSIDCFVSHVPCASASRRPQSMVLFPQPLLQIL